MADHYRGADVRDLIVIRDALTKAPADLAVMAVLARVTASIDAKASGRRGVDADALAVIRPAGRLTRGWNGGIREDLTVTAAIVAPPAPAR